MKNEVNQAVIDIRSPGFLRMKRVLALTGWTKSTLYRRIASGNFPRPIKDIGVAVWRNKDVLDFIERLGERHQPYTGGEV